MFNGDEIRLIDLLRLFVSIIGFGFLAYQIMALRRGMRISSLASLNQQLHQIRDYFVKYPELRNYFYNNQPIADKNPDFNRVVTIAESFLNHMEQHMINKSVFSKNDHKSWSKYMIFVIRSSPIIQRLMHERKIYYSKSFVELFDLVVVSQVASE